MIYFMFDYDNIILRDYLSEVFLSLEKYSPCTRSILIAESISLRTNKPDLRQLFYLRTIKPNLSTLVVLS